MHRASRSLLRGLVAVGCLWTLAGTALAQNLPVAGPVLAVDQVRGAFSNAGYQVDQTLTWDWTSPPVSTVQVHDVSRGRVLMVLVYPTTAAAQLERSQALAREPRLDGGNPHLIAGYGQSLWRGNVAMVQTTQSQLQRIFQLQLDRDDGMYVNPDLVQDPGLPEIAVDGDFQLALERGAANL
jgi:hypothetical protein